MIAARQRVAAIVTQVALAACAGAVDLWAIAGLRGAFASVITGNLVTTGLGLGRAEAAVALPPLIAVLGYAAGVGVWQWLARVPVGALLAAEGGLLAALAVAWWSVDARPTSTASLGLLGLASAAMGGQSAIALRLRASTTYLTGTLTGAVHDLVMRRPGRRLTALGQLAALAAGAVVAALLLDQRVVLPLVPVMLLVLALTAHLTAGGHREL